MQETALMRLASVSKPITASAIQQLAKDGQLDLNAKVFNINGNGGILDITPYNGTLGDSRLRDITVQHLLEHQGGWNRDTAGDLAFRDVQIANAMGVPSPPGILNSARYILSRPLQFTPGTDYNYSNIGYMFLGMVVEDVSGQPYENYVDNYVLTPAGIPAWEVDAGRTFAADQNPREPFYSFESTSAQNVYDPTGPHVSSPYGGWDHEKFLAFGGLIASSKAIAMFAQNRILDGPEIGKLRSDYTTSPEYGWWKGGSLDGTDTLVAQGTWNDTTYSILFDRRPADLSSYSFSLALLLESTLEGISSWPAELVYAGDFTNDQWLTQDDITLFTHALALGSEAAFTAAYPTARYGAGDFDGNGLVNVLDAAGLIGTLQHAGVPAEYISLVPELPGDFNRNGIVDAADYVVWRKTFGVSINLPNETMSLGLVDQADYQVWRAQFGTSLSIGLGATASAAPQAAAIPEPATFAFAALVLLGLVVRVRRPRRKNNLSSNHDEEYHAEAQRRGGVGIQPSALRPQRRSAELAASLCVSLLSLLAFAASTHADIFQWEYINPADPSQGKQQSAVLCPGGAGVDAVPGADLWERDLTMAYLVGADLMNGNGSLANLNYADLSQSSLINARFGGATLAGADLSEADLTNAYFGPINFSCSDFDICTAPGATLTGISFANSNVRRATFRGAILTDADFTGTNVQGADFSKWSSILLYGTGITLSQLYSTASYQAHDLSGIKLRFNNLAGGNFVGQNLTNADFDLATLTDIDFTAADTRGARYLDVPAGAITINLIQPDGHLSDLDLEVGQLLSVRDYDGNPKNFIGNPVPPIPIPITIDQHLAMAPGGTLRTVFEADAWDSTISFAPGIPVTLGGTLELTFAADVNPATQLGRTFHLFDWTGVTPTGAFAIASPYTWDLSNLYTTGEVTLIPEPDTVALIVIAFAVLFSARANRVKTVPMTMGNSASSRNWNVSCHTVARGLILARPTLAPKPWLLPLLPLNPFVHESLKAFLNLLLQFLGQLRAIFEGLPEKNLGLRLKSLVQRARKRLLKRVLNNFLDVNRHLNEPAFKGEYCSPNCTMRPAGDQRRFRRILLVSLSPLLLVSPSPAHADIFQWEYINPADPSQGKRQSTTLAPGGAGVDAVPGAILSGRDLTMAYLIGADLTPWIPGCSFCPAPRPRTSSLYGTNLTDADLSSANVDYAYLVNANLRGANLSNASFEGARLTGADLTAANVRGTSFRPGAIPIFPGGGGITLEQLYSTASYQARDLSGIELGSYLPNYRSLRPDYTGGNFAEQNLTGARFTWMILADCNFSQANLTNASFWAATLTDADFAGAEVRGASFDRGNFWALEGTGITLAQLYSTASYQAHDLSKIVFRYNDLASGNFAGQNLVSTSFFSATLTDADFTGADVRGANFSIYYGGTGITLAQLYSTASYHARDMSGIVLTANDLLGGNFAGQNLTNSSFVAAALSGADFSDANLSNAALSSATLAGADFTNAEVRGASLRYTGITTVQLYSTASYQNHDLTGIDLGGSDLGGGNFSGQNLTNAKLNGATLSDADFTAADMRGADVYPEHADAFATNMIRPNGHINGLGLDAGGLLVVRDYDGDPRYEPARPPIPITIDQQLAIGPGGTLRMVFEADEWDSTISFAPGIPVTLGGMLELTFAADVNLASQIGRTFDLFDWTGVTPTGAFAVSSPYTWNLSNLYTTGEVTLTAIPESSTIALTALGLLGLALHLRWQIPKQLTGGSRGNRGSIWSRKDTNQH
jgi:uncharacterized protein YjbI with pentapeptide repeats/CubicO group peptidase (beta-lactamase class C family)